MSVPRLGVGGRRCLHADSVAADQRQIPPGARSPSYPAREHWGLVWTALEEPVTELPSRPWFDAEEWTWGHGTPFELPVGLGMMIENFRDVSHFAFVHQATFGGDPRGRRAAQVERDGIEVTMRWKMPKRRGGGDMGFVTGNWLPRDRPQLHLGPDVHRRGERCLLHSARAISATESAHYWIQGLSKDFDEARLEEAIAFEERVYAEDRRHLGDQAA